MKKVVLCMALLLTIIVITVFAAEDTNEGDAWVPPTEEESEMLVMTQEVDQNWEALVGSYVDVPSTGIMFNDMEPTHWAFSFIEKMAKNGIINGYPDGSFNPEALVKTGEYMKMLVVTTRGIYCPLEERKEGEHWAMPYAKALDGIAISINDEKALEDSLDTVITRGEVVQLMAPAYKLKRMLDGSYREDDYDESIVRQFSDMRNETNEYLKQSLCYCVQHEIINGFEDGTFRPDEPLTRAQAAKIMCVMKGGVSYEN